MNTSQVQGGSVKDYINSFSGETRTRLVLLRKTIKAAAPEAQEKISYGMPAFTFKGALVYFAGYEKYIGFYPTSSKIEETIPEVAIYRTGKGTLQFPLDQELPIGLVERIVKLRVKENISKGR
jgi:uncharacterized protein YdhG (YjbR/CyaY superfamily)